MFIKNFLFLIELQKNNRCCALTNSYTERTWPIHINDLNCSGSEETIWNCPHNGLISYSCNHNDDAAVSCQSEYIYYTNTYL